MCVQIVILRWVMRLRHRVYNMYDDRVDTSSECLLGVFIKDPAEYKRATRYHIYIYVLYTHDDGPVTTSLANFRKRFVFRRARYAHSVLLYDCRTLLLLLLYTTITLY